MGAIVEVLNSSASNAKGSHRRSRILLGHGLFPGIYAVKVSAPHFCLHDPRSWACVRANLLVNVTLTTLFEAIQLGPLRGPGDDDDWKWTLRPFPTGRCCGCKTTGRNPRRQGRAEDHALKGPYRL